MRDPGRFSPREISASDLVRRHSRAEVWHAMRTGDPISVGALVRRVGLSRSTVSSITKEMLQSGLLRPLGTASSSGGRPPTLFHYQPRARLAAGVTMIDNQIVGALTDLEANPIQFCHRPWAGTDPEGLLHAMAGVAQELIAGVARSQILGVGVGLPGIVDELSGHVVLCISMGWQGQPIPARRVLSEALGLPIFVANRSRIAALGELAAGAGRGLTSLLYMFLGKGVVAGIALDKGIYLGASASAGEIGHTTVVPDGALCRCGNRGCLELYTSESAIVAAAIARARADSTSELNRAAGGNLQLLTIDAVLECARRGDPAALATLGEVGTYLGIALSAALNLLNPEMLVIGGPVGCKAGPLLVEPTVREIRRRTLPLTLSAVRIVAGSPQDQSAALGAAALVLSATTIEQIFSLDGAA